MGSSVIIIPDELIAEDYSRFKPFMMPWNAKDLPQWFKDNMEGHVRVEGGIVAGADMELTIEPNKEDPGTFDCETLGRRVSPLQCPVCKHTDTCEKKPKEE